MRTQDYKPGDRVEVIQGGQLDESFTGVVTRVDPDNFLVFVHNAATGETWGMPTCNIHLIERPSIWEERIRK